MSSAKHAAQTTAGVLGAVVAVPFLGVHSAPVADRQPAVKATLDTEVARLAPHATTVVTRVVSVSQRRAFTIVTGDTLSAIAGQACGSDGDWESIWAQNRTEIPDPNLIYPGQKLTFSCAELAAPVSSAPTPATGTQVDAAPVAQVTGISGTLNCAGLEQLWEQAGGSPAEAFMAAEIAMAESGGEQDALSPTEDYGYWQINASHGPAEATFDALGNARAAIAISDDGTDWDAWTTYVTGAYEGRC